VSRYRVEITDDAYEAFRSQARYIAIDEQAPLNAQRWLEGLWKMVESLETLPRRYRRAPEDALRPYEVRRALYHKHAVLFTIDDENRVVYVLGLRGPGQLPR